MTRRGFLWLLSLIGCRKEDLEVKPAKAFFFAISSPPASVYSAEYQAVLDYADAQTALGVTEYEKPVAFDRTQEDALVTLLVSSGAFALADQIFNLSATGGRKFAMINIKNPGTYNGSLPATNSLWKKGIGFYGDGISKYFRTNFIPGTNGVNYTLNSAGIFISIVNDTGTSSVVDFGASDASLANACFASIRNTGNNLAYRINTSTSSTVANSDAVGKYVISRSASNATKAYKNGVQIGTTSTVASTAITAREIYLNNYNANGSAPTSSTKITGFWLIGGALDAIAASLNTYLSSFETTVQTVTTPSFADKTSVNNYLSSLAQLPASFEYGEPQQSTITANNSGQFFDAILASNGKIYCPPGSSLYALKIDPSNDTATTFGTFSSGSFKYGNSIFANGAVYFIPGNSNVVAKVNISDDSITWLDSTGVVANDTSGNLGATTQKWYGARIGDDGKIYCVPYNATSVLIIDPTTDAITFMDTTGIIATPSGNLSGTQKWDTSAQYGSIIYGVPSDATDMLKIVTSGTPSCSRIGSFPAGTAKWALSGLAANGYIYFFPYFRNTIIRLDPSDDSTTVISPTIGTTDTKIKVIGCAVRPDGKFMLVMHDPAYTDHYTFDPATETLAAFPRLVFNRVNGACLATNGSIYAPPADGTAVVQKFSFPRRTISLPDNFTDNRHVACY